MPFSNPDYGTVVLGGVASYLADLGLVSWDEFETGTAYAANTPWPVFPGPDMPPTPSRIVCLTVTSQQFERANVRTNIQIRIRGVQDELVDDVADQAQAIHDAFYPNGFPLVGALLGTVRANVWPGDIMPVELDGNRRHGSIQNIQVRSRRPRPE